MLAEPSLSSSLSRFPWDYTHTRTDTHMHGHTYMHMYTHRNRHNATFSTEVYLMYGKVHSLMNYNSHAVKCTAS